jgi:hypothetical protein
MTNISESTNRIATTHFGIDFVRKWPVSELDLLLYIYIYWFDVLFWLEGSSVTVSATLPRFRGHKLQEMAQLDEIRHTSAPTRCSYQWSGV